MVRYVGGEQGSPTWLKAREGRITASKIADVCSYLKDGKTPTAKRTNYLWELVGERLTHMAEEHFVSEYMDRGTEMEPIARAAYELAFDVMVEQVGFALHPQFDYSGASPDGLVGEDGMIEIKCPKTTTHLKWKMASVVPEEHIPQMVWGMICFERKWADFVSYDDRIEDPALQVFCVRLELTPELVSYYTAEVVKFEAEIQATIDKLRGIPEAL